MSYPTHLWHVWPRLAGRLARTRRLALFSDFDGTLAPIVPHPWQARLPADTQDALAQLARSPRITLGIVSGRQLAKLRRLVGLGRIYYVGTHGLEWAPPGGRLHTSPVRVRPLIRKIAHELRQGLHGVPHVWVERKSAAVAVHYRNASARHARRAVAKVVQAAQRYASELQLLEGKKVVELLPGGAVSKGAAVEMLLDRWRGPRRSGLAVYLGDDATDETVFARLRTDDLGIFVGTTRQTCARFFLRSPAQVREFLERLRQIVL